MAALWLHDAQVQEHVSNVTPLTVPIRKSVIGGFSAAGWKDTIEMLDCNNTVSC